MKKLNRSYRNFVIPAALVTVFILLVLFTMAFLSSDGKGFLYDSYRIGNMTLTLPKSEKYEEVDQSNASLALVGNNSMCLVFKDDFSIFEDNDVDIPNLYNYTAVIATDNDVAVSQIVTYNGYYGFVKEISANDVDYIYQIYVFMDDASFYTVNFACLKSDEKSIGPKMQDWADMIVINK